MKAYQFNWPSGAIDWYCAESFKRALEGYAKHIGEHIDEIPTPKQLTEKEAKTIKILDIDTYYCEVPEGEDEEKFMNGYRIKCSLYDATKKAKFRQHLATTEF